MGQALYRTYRSRALSEVVGQEHITDTLARAIKAGRVSHAYLFTGPRGTGKTSVARILAHEINGLPYSDTPNLDIIEIDAASNRRIDDIRDLREKVHIAPVSAKFKVYIIDEVHMLTGESFNALLKTLEEPPGHVVFILATTEVHKLPATIISRTQRYAFRPGSPGAIAQHLGMVAKKEGITIDDEALALIAEYGDGSFRDSLSLLDQLAHTATGIVTPRHVIDALGLAPKNQITAIIDALTAGDTQKIMDTLTVLEQQGAHTAAIVDQLSQALLAASQNQPRLLMLVDELIEVPRAYRPKLKLTTVLAKAAIDFRRPAKTTVAAIASPAPTLTLATIPAEPDKPAGPPPELAPEPTPPPVTPIESINAQQWALILAEIKQKSPPIYSVLKQARPQAEDGTLTLAFKFSLHSRKFDDAKQKALVAAAVQAVIGKSPQIKVVINPATQPLVSEVAAIPNTTITDVTEIMGGGEIINGEAI